MLNAQVWQASSFKLEAVLVSVHNLLIPEGLILPAVRFVTTIHRHIVSLCVTSVATNHAFLNLRLIRNVTSTFKTKLSHIPDHVTISVLTRVKLQILILLAYLLNTTEFWKHFETPNNFLGLLAA